MTDPYRGDPSATGPLELFVYWRVAQARLGDALGRLSQAQAALQHDDTALIAAIYVRDERVSEPVEPETGSTVRPAAAVTPSVATVMETYRHPNGFDLERESALHRRVQAALGDLVVGPRHTERFRRTRS